MIKAHQAEIFFINKIKMITATLLKNLQHVRMPVSTPHGAYAYTALSSPLVYASYTCVHINSIARRVGEVLGVIPKES